MNTCAILGSRSLPARYAPVIAAVVSSLAPQSVVTTCGSGPCAFARAAFPSARVFAAADYPASSWAGRLVRRAEACVRFVAGERGVCLFFLSSASSVGSLREIALAVRLGVPVFVFCCGFSGHALPRVGSGAWVEVSSGVLRGAFQWQPVVTQSALF